MQGNTRIVARSILRRVARVGLGLALTGLLTACASDRLPAPGGSLLNALRPYRMDIVQGNVLTREQVAVLKPGMTRAQVRDILGSPLLTDLFHADRWDYVFTIDRPGTPRQQRSVVVLFEGDRMQRVEAVDLPTERDFVASISPSSGKQDVPVLELSAERLQALPKPVRAPEPEAAASAPPTRVYPPLEPS